VAAGWPTHQPPGSSNPPRERHIRAPLAAPLAIKLPAPSSPTLTSLDYKTLSPCSAQIAPLGSTIDAVVLPLHGDTGEPTFLRFFSLFGAALKS
jgi:hypothetical protein